MPNQLQKFTHNGVDIFYNQQNIVYQVTVDSMDLSGIFEVFNESNYNAVKIVYFPPQLEEICFRVFDAIKELYNQNKIGLAAFTSSFVFERFTVLWNYYLLHERQMMGTKLWQHACRFTWKWEQVNNAKVHKGTPYFFLGANQLMQGNFDNAFLFIYNAMEEDKTYATQLGTPDIYKTMPAYLFSSLIVDNPRNYLLPYIQDAKKKMDEFIQTHNTLLGKSFSYNDVDTKFLKNQTLEESKFFFAYNLFGMINHDIIYTPELRSNDFSKLRNLDIIFNLCLIIDKVMKQKTNERYISGSVNKICENHLSEKETENIYRSLNFETDFENAVKKCLSLNYSYNSRTISSEVMILILSRGLRNYGGHNIEAKQLFVDEYQNIVEKLMSALFITLEKLY